ncbi:hypothetical protein [Eubacterium xylanophilum]|uniref:hypothetical protein n=1 Tax=Eubacterium xylanophilum TaxID=39497 RepID=UPI00047D48A7|nr:hypothetical protein [Eubacterium xylanophilum]
MKSKKAIIIGAAAVAFVILLTVIILVVTHKKTINLQDYTKVTFEGYDGYGKAKLDFDNSKFNVDVANAVGININSDAKLDNISSLVSNIEELGKYEKAVSSVSKKLDKTEGLKNGDVVTVSFTYNNDIAGDYKIKYKGEPMTFTVSGLNEVKEVDPFANLKVEFTGISPNVSVKTENSATEDALKTISFDIEKRYGLKLGDKFTIKANASEQFTEQYGIKLSSTEKEYTVDKVDAYITKADDIKGTKALEDMKKQAKDSIKSYLATNKKDFKASGLSYAGFYFLSAKNDSSWGNKNLVYIIYSATVKAKKPNKFKTSKVYFPLEFRDVLKYADGTLYVKLDSTNILGSTGLTYGWFGNVNGYRKTSDMKNDLAISKKSNYDDDTSNFNK